MNAMDKVINKHSKLLTPAEAAEMLGVTVGTLAIWRCNKTNDRPPHIKYPKFVRYLKEDLEKWIESRRVEN